MPEALGNDLGMDAGLKSQGGVGVPEVVEAHRRQHRLLHRLTPVAADAFGIEGGAVLLREDEAALDQNVFLGRRVLGDLAAKQLRKAGPRVQRMPFGQR